jgi:hypothetical protein
MSPRTDLSRRYSNPPMTGATNNREVIKRAVAECDAVLVVLAPLGVRQYASGTAQAVLDYVNR